MGSSRPHKLFKSPSCNLHTSLYPADSQSASGSQALHANRFPKANRSVSVFGCSHSSLRITIHYAFFFFFFSWTTIPESAFPMLFALYWANYETNSCLNWPTASFGWNIPTVGLCANVLQKRCEQQLLRGYSPGIFYPDITVLVDWAWNTTLLPLPRIRTLSVCESERRWYIPSLWRAITARYSSSPRTRTVKVYVDSTQVCEHTVSNMGICFSSLWLTVNQS